MHIKTNDPKPQTYFPAKHLLETGVKWCLVATRLFFREAPFAAERSGAGDLRSTFYCGAKRSWRLAKHLLLRSEAELETCEAPFAAERSGAGDLRSSFLDGLGRALGGFGRFWVRKANMLIVCAFCDFLQIGGIWQNKV